MTMITTHMKAAVLREFGPPDVMKIESVPIAPLEAGEVLIRVCAVSVNRTLDMVVRAGNYKGSPIKLPHVLGVDPSGEIVAVGANVTTRKVGDRVITLPWRVNPLGPPSSAGMSHWGGYAEYLRLPEHAVMAIPDGLDFAAATITARHAPAALNQVRDAANVQAGEWVLIMGASGGLGSTTVQIAKQMGAKVIAGAGSDERVAAAMSLGADHGINYRKQDLTEEVLKITGGAGVAVVLENVGDPELFSKMFMAVARSGRVITSGAFGSGHVDLDLKRLYLYRIRVQGSLGYKYEDFAATLQMAAEGKLKSLIDRTFPLSECVAAHKYMENRSDKGKVLIDPRLG